MKRSILGATLATLTLATITLTSQAASPKPSADDQALLAGISQTQYLALIHTVSECGFEPSPQRAAALLKAPAMAAIVAAMSKPDAPLPTIGRETCAALDKR
ncbi:MAG: hypothetical protein KF891_22040 [Rhizobacter sp.]|nr:hypothetical protein [Rhizobacter sp.]